MSGVGEIVSGVGSMIQGESANRIAKNQAAFMEADAEVARDIGAAEADIARRDGARAVGEAVALQGASGFAMDGSAMDVIAALANDFDYRARTARYEAGRTARRLVNEAAVTRAEGKMARTAGYIQGSASLLKGASSLGSAASGGSGGGEAAGAAGG